MLQNSCRCNVIYTASNLIVHPGQDTKNPALITAVTPEMAGWQYLTMEVRRLPNNAVWEAYSGEHEMAIVLLGGVCSIETNRGNWERIGRRKSVFDGMPYALYLPRHTDFRLRAQTDSLEIAACWCPVTEDHPIRLITPADIKPESRGGANATRQINDIIPPGFDCQRMIAVEVYTPSGNWSSYPPHKHDVHQVGSDGRLIEADLEEVYYYKFDKPEGYAIQRVYTSDGRIEALMMARDNDTVLVPEGYHPVVGAHGYTTYYLNFLAGSAQSLANTDDPEYAWIRPTWKDKDPRVPIVTHSMEQQP